MNRNESVIKAFSIIEYLARCDDWVGLRKLAKDINIDPTTTYRFLSSLKDIGYVKQRPNDNAYQLTLKFAWISSQLLDRIQLRSIVHPRMEQLTAATNETTHLSILEGCELVYIDKVDGNQAIRMRSRVGNRGHLFSTASGKLLLAFLPEPEKREIISNLKLIPLTKNTITNLQILENQLDLTKRQGYGIDDEENEIGIRCIAVPLINHNGQVIAALSLSGWTITITPDRLNHLAEELKAVSRGISLELGYVTDGVF